jgi:insulysin
MAQLEQWLENGRYTWYITGNISHEAAIDIVEKVRATLGLTNLEPSNIGEVLPMAMEAGLCTLLELPLEDKTNENSCVLTHYEVGPIKGDNKQCLINVLLMQYLNEPFFDDLRTKQQLGYVVFSRSVNHRDIVGCQFLVQSSHKACEYLVNSINNFLVETRDKIKAITDEELEVQK